MKYVLYAFCVVSLSFFAMSCKHNPANYPLDYKEMLKPENRGAFARVVSSEGSEWDINNLSSEKFTITLEVDGVDNGSQLKSMEFYIGFKDSLQGSIGDIEPDASKTFRTIGVSKFTQSEESNGLPRVTTVFTSSDLNSALGLSISDIKETSVFQLRWQINLNNGKIFGPDNSGGRLTGGAFYSSPFARNIFVDD